MKTQYNYIDPKTIQLRDRFVEAFPIDDQTKKNIVESILKNGWDKDQPVILAKIQTGTAFLIDGHTRRQAAIETYQQRITYIVKEFESENEAYDYIIGLQFNRRNLTDKEKIQYIQKSIHLFEAAKNKKRFISNLLHCSERTAAKYISILKSPEKLQLVLNDTETINSVQAIKDHNDKKEAGKIVVKKIKSTLEKDLKSLTEDDFSELQKLIREMKKRVKR